MLSAPFNDIKILQRELHMLLRFKSFETIIKIHFATHCDTMRPKTAHYVLQFHSVLLPVSMNFFYTGFSVHSIVF